MTTFKLPAPEVAAAARDWQTFVSSNAKVVKLIPRCKDCRKPGHLQQSQNGPTAFAVHRVFWPCCAVSGPVGGFASEAVQMALALIHGPPK